MGIAEKIGDIEHEMSRMQINKATMHHYGLLKARLAKLRSELLDASSKSSGGLRDGFDVKKSGDARVALVGFPSVGKSTLLNKLTDTESATGAYEFTTLTSIVGVLKHNGTTIQVQDLPGIIEGAADGKGRGKQVIAAARNADLILLMLDAARGEAHKRLLEKELEAMGIRLNKRKPNVTIKVKAGGGLKFNATVPLTHINERLVHQILQIHKIFNVEVLVREDVTVDEFIDVLEGNRKYLPCLCVYNKIDHLTVEEIDAIARRPHSVVISCEWDLNLDYLVEKMWEYLDIIRVYTKRRGSRPDFNEPLIMRRGASVEDICRSIHREMVQSFKFALIWGTSAKHSPQRVGIQLVLEDEDVVQIHAG
nr:developmentally-regulated GTP-binding DRG-2 [Andalucia godoyi]|eukprot:ANDGO_07165.mRNA.1 Developmentally-regulated GTP-binding protein 2 homolog